MIDYKWRTTAELPVVDNVVLGNALSQPPFSRGRRRRDIDLTRPLCHTHGRVERGRDMAVRVSGDAGQGAEGARKGGR